MERKVKYDYEFKLRCVEFVVKKHYSYGVVSKLEGPGKSNIRKWVGFYKKYGKTGLLPRQNQIYSVDFKLKVLQSIDKNLLSLKEASLEFNIPSDSVIFKWQKDFTNFGLEGLQSKTQGRAKTMSNFKRKKRKSDKPLTREEALLLENEALRCELDF